MFLYRFSCESTQIEQQAEMMGKIFETIRSDPRKSCFFPKELREITPLQTCSEACIVGSNDFRYTSLLVLAVFYNIIL
jgi:hypothetical protein